MAPALPDWRHLCLDQRRDACCRHGARRGRTSTALATAAETLIAQNRTTVVTGLLLAVGMLIVSIVMLKGVFPRSVAYLDVATGILGISAEVLRMVFEGLYGPYGVLMLIWMGAVGWNPHRLGTQSHGRL